MSALLFWIVLGAVVMFIDMVIAALDSGKKDKAR